MKIRKGICVLLAACMTLTTVLSGAGKGTGKVYAAESGTLTNGALTENADGWTIGGDFANASDAYGYGFSDGYLSVWTGDAVEKAEFSLTQTIENVAAGDYYAKTAIVGNGEKGASTSKNNLTMTIKDSTTGDEQSKQLITDGWDNWDNTQSTAALSVKEGDSVVITIAGTMGASDWYGLKNVAFLPYVEPVQASINVQQVEGLSKDFIHGVDVSSYLSLVQSGAKYYDAEGKEANLFDIMENAGINYVRLRVWNSPYPLDADGNKIYVEEDGTTTHKASEVTDTKTDAYGGKQYFLADGKEVYLETYGAGVCDVDTAAVIGKIATDHHMRVLIDFHYSDFWADPKKKTVPKTWKDMTLTDKAAALGTFTRESLTTLRDAGVDVGMVQIGNEINNGMAGESDSQNVYTLLKAGSEAVRSVSKDILIAVHFTDPQSEGYQLSRAKELEEAGVEYDAFGTSFYPFWHGDADGLYADLKEISDTYHKKVFVAEISYAWTMEDGDGYGNIVNDGAGDQTYNYTIDTEGQAAAVRDAIAAVSKIGENGLGTFYWEPAWIPVKYAYKADGTKDDAIYKENRKLWTLHGSGWATLYANEYDPEVVDDDNGGTWDNQAFFDFNGKVLDSINVYKWVYTGAKGPVKVATVEDTSCEMTYQSTPELPATVQVNLNNGTSLDVSVTWDAAQVEALKTADFGEYTIDGSLGEFTFEDNQATTKVDAGEWKTTCTVTITGENYVTNGSFETGDDSGWTLTNYQGEDVGWPKVDSNSSNAKTGLYYYTAWCEGDIDFSIDQTISTNPSSGKYTLFAYYQGTGVKELYDRSKLYAKVTYKDGSEKVSEAAVEIHNVWKDFYLAKIDGIVINGNVSSVSVGTRLAGSAIETGIWVVVDDISLMRTGDLSAAEEKIGAASSSTTVKVAKVKSITAKKKSSKAVTVKIKKVSGAKGYQVRYATKKSFKGSKAKLVKKTSVTLKKLKKGKTYYIKARAYKVSGGKKVYGKYSKTVKVKL